MPSEKEIDYIKKATVFELICAFEEAPDRTYTTAEIKQILKAYAIGCGNTSDK